MEKHEDYFSKENLKEYIVDKVNQIEDYNILFRIYRFVRRITN